MTEASAKTARELLALIGALETARKGSRLLDDAIYVWDRDAHARTDKEWLELCRTRGGTIPNWTTSLDAALSLVPEGKRSRIEQNIYDDRTNWVAVVADPIKLGDKHKVFVQGFSDTPALALCIAALNARSAQGIVTRSAETRSGSGSEHRERVEPDPEGDAPGISPLPSGTSEGGVRK